MKKNIYNQIPEGYIPSTKIDPKHSIQLYTQGSVTEVTLDGKSFQVIDPVRMETMAKMVESHEERFFELNQAVKQVRNSTRDLIRQVESLKREMQTLQEKLKENGTFL